MNRFFAAILGAVIVFGGAVSASGQTLNVSVNELEILRLDQPASIVLVANPSIADVAIETAQLLFLLGRRPGETSLIILDDQGQEILSQPIVVTPQIERHVTIQRGLRRAATYTCDPRCLGVPNPERGSSAPGGVAGGGGGDEEEAAPPAAPSATDIAAAAAAAASSAIQAQQKPAQPSN